jgi:hypothetical protein
MSVNEIVSDPLTTCKRTLVVQASKPAHAALEGRTTTSRRRLIPADQRSTGSPCARTSFGVSP